MSITDIKEYDVFPVTISRIVLDLDHAAIASNAIEWINKCERYTTYHDKKLNDEWFDQMPDRDKLVDSIYESVNHLLATTKRKTFVGKDDMFLWGWVSKYEKGDQHGSHNHPRSLISGTYYPQADLSSTKIMYDNPWGPQLMHDSIDMNIIAHTVQPKTGDMMLWPSWLYHRVPPQRQTDVPRIAISFNVDYSRYHK